MIEIDYDELWERVDQDVKERSILALQKKLTPELSQQIRDHISKHGKNEWVHVDPFDHFFFGMQVRNELREAGILDAELPPFDKYYGEGTNVRNWDDYYVQALEAAVA